MTRFLLASALALSLSATASTVDAATYKIDANHTQVWFTYNHHGYANLSGRLNQVSGKLEFDPANPGASSIEIELPMSSLSTGVPKLDAHLLSSDFFEADKYPTASFRSTKVTVLAKDRLALSGDLTIHGVTRPVTLAVTINRTAVHTDAQDADGRLRGDRNHQALGIRRRPHALRRGRRGAAAHRHGSGRAAARGSSGAGRQGRLKWRPDLAGRRA